MKKTISMLLAVLMAAIAVCSFSVIGFADETAANDDPVDSFVTEAPKTEATKAPVTEAPKTEAPKTEAPKTEAPKTEAPKAEDSTATSEDAAKDALDQFISGLLTTKSAAEVSKENEAEEIVTAKPGVTFIDDGEETTKAAPATTAKKPAKVESNIPSTGSSAVPAIALLALAAGTVAVIKTKKED